MESRQPPGEPTPASGRRRCSSVHRQTAAALRLPRLPKVCGPPSTSGHRARVGTDRRPRHRATGSAGGPAPEEGQRRPDLRHTQGGPPGGQTRGPAGAEGGAPHGGPAEEQEGGAALGDPPAGEEPGRRAERRQRAGDVESPDAAGDHVRGRLEEGAACGERPGRPSARAGRRR